MNSRTRQRSLANASAGGMALILALGVLAVLTALSTALLTGFHASLRQAQNRQRQTQCLDIAEAGIEKALIELRFDPTFYTGEQDTPLGDGTFTVAVTPAALERFTLESTGLLNHGPELQARITADALLEPGGSVRVLRWEESYR